MILGIIGILFLIIGLASMGDVLKFILEFLAYLAVPAVVFAVDALSEGHKSKPQKIKKNVIAMVISGCSVLLWIWYMMYKKDFSSRSNVMFLLRSLMIAATLIGLFLRNLINFKCERNPDLHPEHKMYSTWLMTYGMFCFSLGYMWAEAFFGITGAVLIIPGIIGLMTALRPICGTTEEEKAKTKKLDSRRNKIVGIPLTLLLTVVVFTQMSFNFSSTSTSNSRKGKGGYNMPSGNQTLTEYIQQEDPDLWDSMQDRWNRLGTYGSVEE